MQTIIKDQSGSYFPSQAQAKKVVAGTDMKVFKLKRWVRSVQCFNQQWVILDSRDYATWKMCQWVR